MDRLDQVDVLWHEFEAIHGQKPAEDLSFDIIEQVREQSCPEPPDSGDEAEHRVEQALRLARYRRSVHALPEGQSALCLSGGGVRSAAFCLGILQGLARRRVLSQFHYLSTVAGGGYIGCWLTAWVQRRAASRAAGAGADPKQTAFEDVEIAIAGRPAHAATEIPPIRWLRRNQKYLTPRAGMLSGDTWAGTALFVRDLVLNWLVFVPAIAAVLLLPRLLELVLVWWTGFADHSGSMLGWSMLGLARWLGLAAPLDNPPDPPNWKGWTDVAGATLALLSLTTMFQARLSNRPFTDAMFLWRVLLPLIVAGWLITMFNTVILSGGAVPDLVLLRLWAFGVPVTFIAARLIAGALTRTLPAERPLRDWLWDLAGLASAGLMVGALIWLFLWIRSEAVWGRGTVRDLEVFGEPGLLLAFFAGQVVYTALACRAPFGQRDQEWMGRAAGFYLLGGVVWALACGMVAYGEPLRAQLIGLTALAGISGSLTLAGAVSAVTKANAALAAATQKLPATVLMQLAALLFLLSGAVLLTEFTNRLLHFLTGLDLQTRADELVTLLDQQHAAQGQAADGLGQRLLADSVAALAGEAVMLTLIVIALLAATSLALSMVIDVNLFSLHALYRNRLVRSFLGASNLHGVTGAPSARNRFDGFSETDDIKLHEIWRWDPATEPANRRRKGPYPVINIALNLVSGPDPALQERKAAPFVATPFHVGGDLVGYMAHDGKANRRHLSLGTAMAISGAAASPNWGYHSSPLIGFLMTLFNVRLGWWLENPSRAGDTWFPLRSFRLFLQEALGQTRASDPYVYLSDGGHFDNLGLYEMLRRRCSLILAVDATQDANVTLDDLGRTLRQVSIDMGITVEFQQIPFRKRADPAAAGLYATIGSITYPETTRKGTLIYVKPGFLADAPADVRAYAAGDPKFPHDSTINQWFTESQFESYRTLGAHVAALLCGPVRTSDPTLPISELAHTAGQYLHENRSKN